MQRRLSIAMALVSDPEEEADALADTVAIIDDGKLIAQGTPTELKSGIAGNQVTVVEASNLTDKAVETLAGIGQASR